MPTHDRLPRHGVEKRERGFALRLSLAIKHRSRKRRDDKEGGEGVPVEPTRPNNLTGGAAAALEFDD